MRRDSDKLLVLVDRAGLSVSRGTGFAVRRAETLGKPYIVICLDDMDARARATAFLGEGQGPSALNIAGPRESEAPRIYAKARAFLGALLANKA